MALRQIRITSDGDPTTAAESTHAIDAITGEDLRDAIPVEYAQRIRRVMGRVGGSRGR